MPNGDSSYSLKLLQSEASNDDKEASIVNIWC